MKKYLILFLLFACNLSYAQQIYQWTDAEGNEVFSDKPHPGAKKIEVSELPSSTASSNPTTTTPPQTTATQPTSTSTQASVQTPAAKKPGSYQSITITQPTDQETIWSNPGTITVSVDVKPQLMPNDTLSVLVDGQEKATSASGTTVQLNNLDRGAHTLQARIIGPQANVIKTSNKITVYLQKTHI